MTGWTPLPVFWRVLEQLQAHKCSGWHSIWNRPTANLHSWGWLERDWIWVDLGCSRGIRFGLLRMFFSCAGIWGAREQLPRFLRRNVVVIRAASAIPVCRMQLFSRPQRQQLHHRHMGNREADHEELTATCLSAPPSALYPSTSFAVHRTSSQSAPDRNKGATQRSRPL
jgi:hypothetical protein